MAENDTDIEVYGRVTGPGGREVRGARVVVFWQHIRTRQQLASTETDREGRYRCRFEAPAHPLGKVLLVVEARGEDLSGPLESPLVEAQLLVRVDLQAEAVDESEWGVLLRSVRPLLDGLELTNLVESEQHHDLSFLARELGQDAETFMRVVVAARLAAAHQAVPAAVFYAFLRQRVPAALPVPLLEASQDFTLIDPLVRRVASLIFALDPTAQQTTLASAIAKGLIPAQLSEQLDAIVRALQAQRATDTAPSALSHRQGHARAAA